jgi:hypothetical protein
MGCSSILQNPLKDKKIVTLIANGIKREKALA